MAANFLKVYGVILWASIVLANCPSSFLAGQRVIYSYTGLTPPEQLLNLTRQGKVGGIILFLDNIGSSTKTAIADIQAAYASAPCSVSGAPLLIMTDQEGGEVRRITNGGPFLSAKEMGESANPAAAGATGGTQAAEALIPYGINTNLAPVLDVYREPGNFIDEYQRSFGNTSALVAECAAPFISAQQARGVIATSKHFPGLGAAATSEDTDVEPVTLNLTLNELRSIDEAPYKAAIAAGVKMVMASWALYPALDDGYPSGLSKKWIQGELRDRLGFTGVTVTDALEAGALKSFGDTNKRAVLAANAGMDLILAASQDVAQGEAAVEALAEAYDAGTLAKAEFEDATQRVLNLRKFLK